MQVILSFFQFSSLIFFWHLNILFSVHLSITFFPLTVPSLLNYTHIYRYSYSTVRNKRSTKVSSFCMRCLSASLPIRVKGPASYGLKCRANVSQCFVPTNLINLPHCPLLCAINVHRCALGIQLAY